MSPVEDDPDMWAAISRLLSQAVTFMQVHGGLMTITAIIAWFMGIERGYKGSALFVKTIVAIVLAFVFVPFLLWEADLDTQWGYPLAVFIGWRGPGILTWGEAWALKRLGLTRSDIQQPWDVVERRMHGRADGPPKDGHDRGE